LGGETIEMRSLIIRTTVATQITIPEIISENEEDVWRSCRASGRERLAY
jgi:hypothetical protein